MSWDVMLARFPEGATSLDDITSDWMPEPFTTGREFLQACLEVDPSTYVDRGYLNFGPFQAAFDDPDEVIDTVMFNGHGAVDSGMGALAALIDRFGVGALDPQTGELFAPLTASTSVTAWQAWRDRVLAADRDG